MVDFFVLRDIWNGFCYGIINGVFFCDDLFGYCIMQIIRKKGCLMLLQYNRFILGRYECIVISFN